MFLLVAYLTDKSTRMIVDMASFHPKLQHLGVYTYEDLASIPFGKVGYRMVLGGMLVLAYGAMVSYLLIIKDTVPVIFGATDKDGQGDFWETEFIMTLTSLIVILPLSLLRDIANLSYTSVLSVTADVLLVVFVILFSPVPSTLEENGGLGNVLKDNWANKRLFIGFGVMSFAMTVQHSALLLGNSFKDKTPERWAQVTFRAVALATILCLGMGIFGYLGFLDDTRGNVLKNFDVDSVMANAGRALLAVTMFFTYPMEAFVARHVICQMFYAGDMDGMTVHQETGESVPLPKLCGVFGRREKITIVLYLASLIPALVVDDLGPVLSITGSLGSSIVAYVACGTVYLGLNGEAFLEYCKEALQNHGYKVDKTHKPSEVELPVVGDSKATMTTKNDAQNVQESTDSIEVASKQLPQLPTGMKPWWWYLGLFPIWTAIASRGALNTRSFLENMQQQANNEDVVENFSNEVPPNKFDFYMSMFLIAFGIFATVVGVISNIYVQVNEVFFTPT